MGEGSYSLPPPPSNSLPSRCCKSSLFPVSFRQQSREVAYTPRRSPSCQINGQRGPTKPADDLVKAHLCRSDQVLSNISLPSLAQSQIARAIPRRPQQSSIIDKIYCATHGNLLFRARLSNTCFLCAVVPTRALQGSVVCLLCSRAFRPGRLKHVPLLAFRPSSSGSTSERHVSNPGE